MLWPTGVKRRVWGYVTPSAEEKTNPKAFNDDTMYEGQASILGT